MDLKPKVTLKQKGETTRLPLTSFHVTLRWHSAVDLDLMAFYRAKNNAVIEEKPAKGFFGKILNAMKSSYEKEGQIYFGAKGHQDQFPWIRLDQDAGVGDKGGANEENMCFSKLDAMEHILIVTNIFNKPNAVFSSYDGVVSLKANDQVFEVPLSASEPGNYCVIARIDNSGSNPILLNENRIFAKEPTIAEVVGA